MWSVSTGVHSGHEAPPIVNNGVMFVATPYSQVMALDAATGELLWRYKRKLPAGFAALHNTSRGVGLYGDKVFFPTLDATLVALDAKTGKVAWEAKVADWKDGYYMTMAPLIVKGKVLVGVSGGEFGVRGFVEAFDAETGKSAWKTYTIPAPGEPGSETWEKPDTWKTGGGATWMTGNYDPATNTVYWGIGNAFALVRRSAAGRQSLYGLDARAGRRHRQDQGALPVPPERVLGLGRDECADAGGFPEGRRNEGLADAAAQRLPLLAGRNADGSISYLDSEAYVPQDVFKSIDPKTGRPDVDLAHKPGTGKAAQFCPGLWGGKDWPYEAYNPKTGMVYIPSNENHCNNLEGKVEQRIPGQWWTGVAIPDFHFSVDTKAGFYGELQAYDVETGKRVWRDLYSNSMNWGSLLTTAGGLLFAGGTNDRMFRAYDAKTGEELWHFRTNSGIIAPPSTFEVNGVQYVAVESGYGVDPAFQQTLMADLVGWNPDVPQGGVVWVFAVQK